MKKLLGYIGAICLAGMLVAPFTTNAIQIQLSLDDDFYLGWVHPSQPADPDKEEAFINQLIGMSAPSVETVNGGRIYSRSDNVFADLPAAEWERKYEQEGTGANNTFPLPSPNPNVLTLPDSYVYLLGKYGTTSHVWVISSLSSGDVVVIPASGLSHISLFNKQDAPPVPDGGTTLLLLGSALIGLTVLRRKLA